MFTRIVRDAADVGTIAIRRRGEEFVASRAVDTPTVSAQLNVAAAASGATARRHAAAPPRPPPVARGMGPRGLVRGMKMGGRPVPPATCWPSAWSRRRRGQR
jgi:hypothetical protein